LFFKQEVQTEEEMLLADRPEVYKLSKLVFKVKTDKSRSSWELKAKVY